MKIDDKDTEGTPTSYSYDTFEDDAGRVWIVLATSQSFPVPGAPGGVGTDGDDITMPLDVFLAFARDQE